MTDHAITNIMDHLFALDRMSSRTSLRRRSGRGGRPGGDAASESLRDQRRFYFDRRRASGRRRQAIARCNDGPWRAGDWVGDGEIPDRDDQGDRHPREGHARRNERGISFGGVVPSDGTCFEGSGPLDEGGEGWWDVSCGEDEVQLLRRKASTSSSPRCKTRTEEPVLHRSGLVSACRRFAAGRASVGHRLLNSNGRVSPSVSAATRRRPARHTRVCPRLEAKCRASCRGFRGWHSGLQWSGSEEPARCRPPPFSSPLAPSRTCSLPMTRRRSSVGSSPLFWSCGGVRAGWRATSSTAGRHRTGRDRARAEVLRRSTSAARTCVRGCIRSCSASSSRATAVRAASGMRSASSRPTRAPGRRRLERCAAPSTSAPRWTSTTQGKLDALPGDAFRAVLKMVDLDELTYREAAKELGVPVGTVMSRLHRGRKLLATQLQEAA